jgi:hypothetical protein
MTPRQIRAARLSKGFMPGLWAFAYPPSGRPLRWVRLQAMVLWRWLFGLHWRRSERL